MIFATRLIMVEYISFIIVIIFFIIIYVFIIVCYELPVEEVTTAEDFVEDPDKPALPEGVTDEIHQRLQELAQKEFETVDNEKGWFTTYLLNMLISCEFSYKHIYVSPYHSFCFYICFYYYL